MAILNDAETVWNAHISTSVFDNNQLLVKSTTLPSKKRQREIIRSQNRRTLQMNPVPRLSQETRRTRTTSYYSNQKRVVELDYN